jgi:hypothetical protein
MTQYSIVINGEQFIYDEYPKEKWENISLVSDNRSIQAKLFKREVFTDDGSFLETLTDRTGYIFLKNKNQIITPWNLIAELK